MLTELSSDTDFDFDEDFDDDFDVDFDLDLEFVVDDFDPFRRCRCRPEGALTAFSVISGLGLDATFRDSRRCRGRLRL